MRKTLPVLLILLFIYSTIFAQTENKDLSISNSKTVNVPQQSDYSESVPYKPREFKVEQKSKSKKEKKTKKDAEKENQTVPPIDEAQNKTSDDSVIAENVPITIPVSVFDANGKPVQNLKKSDFKIFVDDKEQEISDFGVSDQPLNLILILDVSPSTYYDIEEIQKYATTVVGQLRPQDKVMVITFSERAQILADLTDDRQQMNKAIKKAKFGDGTSLYEAIKFSLQKRISQISGRKFIVMLTDGVDTTSRAATFADSLLEAEKNDALFFPVYIDTSQSIYKSFGRKGNFNDQILQQILSQNLGGGKNLGSSDEEYELGREYLADLALLSGGRAIMVKNLKDINKTGFENVFEAFRNQFYLRVNYSGSGTPGQRKQIKVRVNRPNLTVKTRGSYIIGASLQTPK